MKKIVLLAVFALSPLFVACGDDDATTCEEAIELTAEKCEDEEIDVSKEEGIADCEQSPHKETQIECSNKDSCEEIIDCNIAARGPSQ